MQQYYHTNINLPADYSFHNGFIILNHLPSSPSVTAEEAIDVDFSNNIWYSFNINNSTGIGYNTLYCRSSKNISALISGNFIPKFWESVNILGKAIYLSFLASLGRNNSAESNMLADPYRLKKLSKNVIIINVTLTKKFRQYLLVDEAEYSYNAFSKDLNPGPLGIPPAILTTNYIC